MNHKSMKRRAFRGHDFELNHLEVAPNMLLMGEDSSVVEEVALDDNGMIETVEEIPQDEHDGFTDDGQLELVVEESDGHGNFVHMDNGDSNMLLYDNDGAVGGDEEDAEDNDAHFNEMEIKQEKLSDKAAEVKTVTVQMEITEPLSTLRRLVEQQLHRSLTKCHYTLQDTLSLDESRNLADQCVQGAGLVQIQAEVKYEKGRKPVINIVDVLKPADEIGSQPSSAARTMPRTRVVVPMADDQSVTRWVVDQHFRRDQERLKIPADPLMWNEAHVQHWAQWAVNQFRLEGINLPDFNITGKQLTSLSHEEFAKLVPDDPGDIFWTHLELLRKCKFVAVVQQPPQTFALVAQPTVPRNKSIHRRQKPIALATNSDKPTPGNRTGNNGQVQLWQFLLDLLTDKCYRDIIQWLGEEGEFKLINPELVAQLWGSRKNKTNMNYEKLSRALRYYYDGDMICKVHGKRFVYKFVCDLRTLVGYSPTELNRLVVECAEKYRAEGGSLLSHSLMPPISTRSSYSDNEDV